MFKIFKKFVIYLLLLPHTFPQPIDPKDSSKETTLDVEQVMQKEMVIFAKYLDKIPDDVDRADFRGDLRMLARRAVMAEMKNEQLLEDRGGLKSQKKNYEKVLRIIGARTKLEGLVDKLYPLRKNTKTGEMIYGKPDSSYCDALNEMLQSKDERFTQDPFISMLRKRLIDNGITVPIFMKFSRWLYNQFSDKACHKMAQFSPPLPRYNDTNAINEMLECVEIDADIPAAICLKIMLQPLDLPTTT